MTNNHDKMLASLSARKAWAIVAMAVAIALLVGFYRLGDRPFWFDEAFSYAAARTDTARLVRTILRGDPSQGLYYVLLHFWLFLGDGEATIRVLSVLAGAATIPVVFLLGRRLFDERAGLLAAILLSINPFFIEQSQEARAYTLVMLLATTATLVFTIAIEKQANRWWIGYAAVAAASVFAHAFALWVILAHGLSVLLLGDPASRRRNLTRAGISLAIAAVVAIPIARIAFGSTRFSFIGLPHSSDVARQVSLLLGHQSWFLLLALFLVSMSAARFARALIDKELVLQRRYGVVLLWFFVPLIGSLLGSFIKPMFAPRYLTLCLPAFTLLLGAGIRQIGHRLAMAGIAMLLALTSCIGMNRWFEHPPLYKSRPWDEATAYVFTEGRDGDTVMFDGSASAIPFSYYRLTGDDPPRFVYPYLPAAVNDGQAEYRLDESFARFESAAYRPKRVWLITSVGSFGGPARSTLEANYEESFFEDFESIGVHLYRLERSD